MRAPITSHILDTHTGTPVEGIPVTLSRCDAGPPELMAAAITNSDGRVENWDTDYELIAGQFRLTFAVADYFAARAEDTFYPTITIDFCVEDISQHYHVPLLLSGFGYSTYRGS